MFKNKYRVTKPRGRSATSSSSSSLPSKRGLFANGIWLCDCDPRLPAERFQVKKDGKNKGRWFYTCQKAQELRCTFFLWADDAALRMEATVIANGPTEPPADPPKSSPAAPPRNDPEWPTRPSPPKRRKLPWATESPATGPPAKVNRNRPSPSVSPPPLSRQHASKPAETEDADEDPFALSSDNEAALAALPMTPRKPHPTAAPADPQTPHRPSRTAPTGLQTPGTTPHTKLSVSGLPADAPPTPTRARTTDQAATQPDTPASTSTEQTGSLYARVTALLGAHGTHLPAAPALALRALLETEARRTTGLARGRDAARAAVTARDARIAGLVARVARLEGDVEAERGLRRAARAGAGERR